MNRSDTAETPETRLGHIGIALPQAPPAPIGSFCNVRRSGSLVFVSGQGPVEADGTLRRGKVGGDVTAEAARDDARLVAVNILAALRHHLGSLRARFPAWSSCSDWSTPRPSFPAIPS